jgi:hypothetical protein
MSNHRPAFARRAAALGVAVLLVAMAGAPLAAQTPAQIQSALDAAHSKNINLKEGANPTTSRRSPS